MYKKKENSKKTKIKKKTTAENIKPGLDDRNNL